MDATPTKRLNSVLSRSDHSSRNAEDDFRSEWKSKVRERGHTEGASPPRTHGTTGAMGALFPNPAPLGSAPPNSL